MNLTLTAQYGNQSMHNTLHLVEKKLNGKLPFISFVIPSVTSIQIESNYQPDSDQSHYDVLRCNKMQLLSYHIFSIPGIRRGSQVMATPIIFNAEKIS